MEPIKLPTVVANSKWAKDAEICSCDPVNRVERVIYICLEKKCPLYPKQKFYCAKCLENGGHEHFKHANIKN